MADDPASPGLVAALYRFAWALTGEETTAAALTQRVLSMDHHPADLSRDSRVTEVAVFTTAFRLYSGDSAMRVPPSHDRVANMTSLSLQQAEALGSVSLLKSFRGLELPQRAALVLFYTTHCSLQDIAAVLRQSREDAVAIIARGKAEWLHILQQTGSLDQPGKETP